MIFGVVYFGSIDQVQKPGLGLNLIHLTVFVKLPVTRRGGFEG